MDGYFELRTHDKAKEKKKYIEDDPFRLCLVINLFKPHLGLFMKLDNGHQAPADAEKDHIPSKVIIEKVRKSYSDLGVNALKWLCMIKGHSQAVNKEQVKAYRLALKMQDKYKINYRLLAEELAPGQKKPYRDLKTQKAILKEISDEVSDGTIELIDANTLEPEADTI